MSIAAKLAVLFVLLGLFFRFYQPLTRLGYGHDTDLASWIIKDIMIDGHPRLIGQLTTQPGVFIGSLTYYAQIPGYWISRFDPAGNLFWSFIACLFSLVSIFWVTYRLYGKKTAVITTMMFAVSFDISRTERVAVPTALVFVWSSWFYYFLVKLFSGDSKSLYFLAILFSLVWHLSLALGLLFPLVILGIILNTKSLKLKHLALSFVLGLVLTSPLLVFELKHNFQQIQAVINSQNTALTWDRLLHTVSYAARNLNETYWNRPVGVTLWLLPILFVTSLLWLTVKGIFSQKWTLVIFAWFALIIGFFANNAINLSEYYLHGLTIVWIMVFGIVLSRLNTKLAFVILGTVVTLNLNRLINHVPDTNGYLQRKAVTALIAQDAKLRGYPCVAISYMTDVGNNLGYRYLFYLTSLAVNAPSSEAPVYTIVFPHIRANRLDKTFGSLGLILPEYSKYTADGVKISCANNRNDNLNESMFGFTK